MESVRRAVRIASLTAAVAVLAAACGGSSGEASAASCDGEVTVDTIDAWAHEGSEAGAYQTMVDDFNAGPGQELGVTVDLTLIPEGEYTDQVNAAAAAGDLPALLDFDGPNLANLAWSGHIVPLDECIPDDVRTNLLPSIIEGGSYNGSLYSVASFDSGLGLYASRSALESVGAPIPASAAEAWTAEETEQILRDLQGAGFEHPLDIKIWYGTQGEWMTYGFSPILQSAGADLVDRDTLQAVGGTRQGQAGLRRQRWLVVSGHFRPSLSSEG
jgi:multiple sugar transport system substrate-binding protein